MHKVFTINNLPHLLSMCACFFFPIQLILPSGLKILLLFDVYLTSVEICQWNYNFTNFLADFDNTAVTLLYSCVFLSPEQQQMRHMVCGWKLRPEVWMVPHFHWPRRRYIMLNPSNLFLVVQLFCTMHQVFIWLNLLLGCRKAQINSSCHLAELLNSRCVVLPGLDCRPTFWIAFA